MGCHLTVFIKIFQKNHPLKKICTFKLIKGILFGLLAVNLLFKGEITKHFSNNLTNIIIYILPT